MTIADEKLTKSLDNFENKQPNCTILFIFLFQSSSIDCILSKIVGFDQLWTASEQKLVTANRKLVFLKTPNTLVSLLSKTVVMFYRVVYYYGSTYGQYL